MLTIHFPNTARRINQLHDIKGNMVYRSVAKDSAQHQFLLPEPESMLLLGVLDGDVLETQWVYSPGY